MKKMILSCLRTVHPTPVDFCSLEVRCMSVGSVARVVQSRTEPTLKIRKTSCHQRWTHPPEEQSNWGSTREGRPRGSSSDWAAPSAFVARQTTCSATGRIWSAACTADAGASRGRPPRRQTRPSPARAVTLSWWRWTAARWGRATTRRRPGTRCGTGQGFGQVALTRNKENSVQKRRRWTEKGKKKSWRTNHYTMDVNLKVRKKIVKTSEKKRGGEDRDRHEWKCSNWTIKKRRHGQETKSADVKQEPRKAWQCGTNSRAKH